jgi:hypothetical protein
MARARQEPGRQAGARRLVVLAAMGLALCLAALVGTRSTVPGARSSSAPGRRVARALGLAATRAAESLWNGYLAAQGGTAGDLASFRRHLQVRGILDAGPGGPPGEHEGTDLLAELGPADDRTRTGEFELAALRIVRRDAADSTRLFLTASAASGPAAGLAAEGTALQHEYTAAPSAFTGFDFALLANDVSCLLCHARVDSAERWWNSSSDRVGRFAHVQVGTLESLVVPHDGTAPIDDRDADSSIAGTLHVGGLAVESSGRALTSWDEQSLRAHPFDAITGNLREGPRGLELAPFDPRGSNLLLDQAARGQGALPERFPSPFPDDGGLDPRTGAFDAAGAGSARIDDCEFLDVARHARGVLTAGHVHVVAPGERIQTSTEYETAFFAGNRPEGLRDDGEGVRGHVVLVGTSRDPIRIAGTLAIDGDLVLQGVVEGSGALYVRGNLYVPTDLVYADGQTSLPGDEPGRPSGPRTFGVAADGTHNALALAAGGNILIGDFQRAAVRQPDGARVGPEPLEIVSGDPDGGWNFALAQLARFNRAEHAKTMATLSGPDGIAVPNPGHVPGHVPRYYAFGPNTTIPILPEDESWFDPLTRTWQGPETASPCDPRRLRTARPDDPRDPQLFAADGTPVSVLSSLAHTDGWIEAALYQQALAPFESTRAANTPMRIDALLYTSNALLCLAPRDSVFAGSLVLNGALVAADVGLLVPGKRDLVERYPNHSSNPGSRYAIGLQLNYDPRPKAALRIVDPLRVRLERSDRNPRAGLL